MAKLDLRFLSYLLRFRRRFAHVNHLHVFHACLLKSTLLRIFVKLDSTVWASGETIHRYNIFAIGCTSYVGFLYVSFVVGIRIVKNDFATFFIRLEMRSVLPGLPTAL